MQQAKLITENNLQIQAIRQELSSLTIQQNQEHEVVSRTIEIVNQTALDRTSSAVSNLASIVNESGLRLDNKLASVETGLGSTIAAHSVDVDLTIKSVETSLESAISSGDASVTLQSISSLEAWSSAVSREQNIFYHLWWVEG